MSTQTIGDEYVDWLNDWPHDLIGKIRHANDLLDWAFGGLPSILREKIDRLWAKIVEYTEKIVQWCQDEVCPYLLAPFTLGNASQDWTTAVLDKVSDAGARLDGSQFRADEYWHGPAARAYSQVAAAQEDAAKAMVETVEEIQETLHDLSFKMKMLYVGLAATLVIAVGLVVTGTSLLPEIVTIPAGLASILSGLLVAVGGIGAIVTYSHSLADSTSGSLNGLRVAFHDNTGLPNGAWPKAVRDNPADSIPTGLTDASLTDGDRSDWTIYQDPTNP